MCYAFGGEACGMRHTPGGFLEGCFCGLGNTARLLFVQERRARVRKGGQGLDRITEL